MSTRTGERPPTGSAGSAGSARRARGAGSAGSTRGAGSARSAGSAGGAGGVGTGEREPAPTRAPGRPRSVEAEKAILGATIELLTERGIGGLSVEAVAARAGVAKTTIYRRWPTKEDLVLAAVSALKGQPPRLAGRSVRDDLLRLVRQVGRRNAAGPWPALMTRLLTEADDHPELVAEAWRRSTGPRRALLQDILRRGVADGLIRPGADLELVTDMLVAPVVARTRPGRGPLSDAQITELVDTVLAGLRP